jgi:probable F420-dependent oxidoreductase
VEPFAALSFIAGITKTIRLGTGVAIFPARPPIHLARLIATADVLSGGRVSLGIGTGWLRDEFDISLASFDERGPRLDEQLEILDRLFNDARPEFHGSYYDMPAIGFEPKPIQRPHPPFLIGGTADVALRRAARVGDGWYGGGGSPDAAVKTLNRLHKLRRDYGRTGDFEITMILGWGQGFDADLVAQYEDIGVHRLVATPWPRSSQAVEGMTQFASDAGLVPQS